MKKKVFFALVMIITAASLQAKNLKALFAYKTFYSPEKGSYVETYLSVFGSSVEFKELKNGKFQGAIEITAKFSLGADVKNIDKYNLLSPEVEANNNITFNFLDQQRISLPNGKYNLELTIKDKNSEAVPFTLTQEIEIEYYPNTVSVSDVEMVESYTKTDNATSMLNKNGYEIVPAVDNFFYEEKNTLNFYAEIYNTDKIFLAEPFLLNYYIQNHEKKSIISEFSSFSKKQPANVIPVLAGFNISTLPAGNYNLVVDVKNKNNELVATKSVFFMRQSKNHNEAVANINDVNTTGTFADMYSDKEVLAEHIASLQPIANARETDYIDNQLKLSDIVYMKKFFYHFWNQRDAINPEQAWENYKKEVETVQASYGTRVIKGYNTDRGRVYLQYGKPNTITSSLNEPSSYPYEVWHFYKIKNQSNKKFVFYNKDLIGKNFILLHSDMQGEPYDQQWEAKLHSRNYNPGNFDDKSSPDYYGKKTEENFTTPR
jgi:GWxTD domain-containing protein